MTKEAEFVAPQAPPLFDRDLVFEFFWKFSVFECLLKRNGFLKSGTTAKPDWGRFGREIRGCFSKISDPEFNNSLNEFTKLSPKRQVVRDGQLAWDWITREPNHSDESYILELLKNVRNNLFHGGKYPDGPVEEIARNKKILKVALTILERCYTLHPRLKKFD